MSIRDLENGIKNGRDQFLYIMNCARKLKVPESSSYAEFSKVPDVMESDPKFDYMERHVCSGGSIGNELALGDNAAYMKWLLDEGYAGRLQMIYIDPPFFTKAKYNATVNVRDAGGSSHKIHHLAYDDRFERNIEYYIENMTVRLLLMKELLADDGLMWIHLDWHSSHYIKLLLDELMGEKNFVNEIIWSYKSGGSGKRHFSRKHDSILVYAKTSNYFLNVPQEKSYNRGFKPYNFKGVKEYQDEQGWYTLVNMKDVWSIDMVGRTSKERTGYATQKPMELMRRIVESSSRPGDMVGDFFCGSGSLLEAAEEMGRRWVGCDNEELATAMSKKRLSRTEANYIYRTESSQPLRKGRVVLEKNREEKLENGRKMYSYGIAAFEPDIETGYIQLADRQYVQEALMNDTMQFIDYVMIDPDYSGEFSCEIVVEEDWNNMCFISGDNAAFIVVDVLGREYFTEIHP